ncbi:outer membrane protein assembly factor BamD [Marinospirillum sp.]|uniref:outer membrane protein assembly factor BamD n=1 Tax=Marinospirillum sp. TaxID=2183934 RepID=UPI002870461B|nr:outer membrane protein assembly factor BamD [Marinospirillum sp.]MDR9469110.1 outer membrane protein assembly factor BamD [Marinospirillum sp.]
MPAIARLKPLLTLLLVGSLTTLLLTGCAGRIADEDKTEQQLYQEAQEALDNNRYTTAIERLQALESRFPFGEYGEQAQLELIYANYQSNQYEAARAAAGRFIRLNPDHPQVDYAHYLRGLAAWEGGRHALEGLELSDISKRDPGATREAYGDFRRLILDHPDSQYAPDAVQRLRYLKNLLAEQEVYIGQFYLRRGAPVAAINRGKEVVEGYRDTPAVPDAIAVMIEGYLHLEDQKEADRLKQLLVELDPEHPQLGRNQQFVQLHPANKPDKTLLQILSFDLLRF